jgi:6-phosphogluconolactonase
VPAPTIATFPDPEALARAAAERLVALCAAAVRERGAAHVALAGGATPRRLYERLPAEAVAGGLDWARVHLWFGDERCVPPDHAESNYGMVRDALLASIPAPGPRVHRMEAERSNLWLAAAEYARLLRREVPAGPDGTPALDLVLLGLGADGHTASLFPGTCILRDHRNVGPVYVPRLKSWRISLTLRVLNGARHVLFLVAGADKSDAVRAVLGGASGGEPLPAARVTPAGNLEWYLDEAAASGLIQSTYYAGPRMNTDTDG